MMIPAERRVSSIAQRITVEAAIQSSVESRTPRW